MENSITYLKLRAAYARHCRRCARLGIVPRRPPKKNQLQKRAENYRRWVADLRRYAVEITPDIDATMERPPRIQYKRVEVWEESGNAQISHSEWRIDMRTAQKDAHGRWQPRREWQDAQGNWHIRKNIITRECWSEELGRVVKAAKYL